MKIVSYKDQYRITVPKDIIIDKGWKAGTILRFVEDKDGNIFLKEVKSSGEDSK